MLMAWKWPPISRNMQLCKSPDKTLRSCADGDWPIPRNNASTFALARRVHVQLRRLTFSSRALWCSKRLLRALSTSTSLETPDCAAACRFTTVILRDRSCLDTRHSRCSSRSCKRKRPLTIHQTARFTFKKASNLNTIWHVKKGREGFLLCRKWERHIMCLYPPRN